MFIELTVINNNHYCIDNTDSVIIIYRNPGHAFCMEWNQMYASEILEETWSGLNSGAFHKEWVNFGAEYKIALQKYLKLKMFL